MSNIQVHKNGEKQPTAMTTEPARRWDPFRAMREMLAWDPFAEMAPIPTLPGAFNPSFEVKETKDAYCFKADVPGVKESDIEVTMTGNRLTISGKRESEKKEQTDTYYTYERSYGDFSRAFTMPDGIDANGVHADLTNGVLAVTIKKLPTEQPKKIAVQTPAKKS